MSTPATHAYAQQLVEAHREGIDRIDVSLRSGAVTPTEEVHSYEHYQPKPSKYRGGILGQLLKLYHHDQEPGSRHERQLPPDVAASTAFYSFARGTATDLPIITPSGSPPGSGATTPRNNSWFSKSPSSTSLSQLIGGTSGLATPGLTGLGEEVAKRLSEQKQKRPHLKDRVRSSATFNAINKHVRPKTDAELRIKKHISEIIQRQQYLVKLCQGLMMYGAPSHRLEEYMKMSARVLEIEAQFAYIPGAMFMSFNDPTTHTSELKLIKAPQGLDLGRLRDVHEVYKEVVHDRMSVSTAKDNLNRIFKRQSKHSRLVLIPVYGLASVCVGPFAFKARLIDLPVAFVLGAIVGIMQLFIAPASDLYSNVFEIAAAVVTSFLARAFGSIQYEGTRLFCFSALAQSSIALILPGYIVLLASLELQSKSIIAGSVRMIYSIIYSLFLGYGITLGAAIYGLLDRNATSEIVCGGELDNRWYFLFVPGFTMCLIIINQAKWKQAPMMLFISAAGYAASYFSSKRFASNAQLSSMLGALAIGVLANGYSRVGGKLENAALDIWEHWLQPRWLRCRCTLFSIKEKITPKELEGGGMDTSETHKKHPRRVGYSLAAAAMLPAIFVQVPSGLAVGGSLLTGLATADQIVANNLSNTLNNATMISNATDVSAAATPLNTVAFNVGYSVVQIAIGITVGLFLSAIVVYPLGKKRSGLFSF